MGSAKIKVTWKPEALVSLQCIYDYIWEQSPHNAENFNHKLINFGNSLGDFPLKYAVCRNKFFRKQKYRCATFKKNWVFLYSVTDNELYIHNIIHAKTIL